MTARLVAVCGLPGVGKSTVARAVADRLDARTIRTDVVRRELFDDPGYTDEERLRVYEAALDRAEAALDAGRAVVVDGTFERPTHRDRARAVAERAGAAFDLVRVVCDDAVARERIAAREGDESEADVAVYDSFRESFVPPDDCAVVDNSGEREATRRRIRELFDSASDGNQSDERTGWRDGRD